MPINLNDQAQATLKLAEAEARGLNHGYIGTEHILLALLQKGTGLEADLLATFGLDADKVRAEIARLIQPGQDPINLPKLPLTPRAQRVIEYAAEDARTLQQKQIGTEHLLLGLFREPDGVAAKALLNLGLKLDAVRLEAYRLRLRQMILVERVVRPVRATVGRKRKLREELLAHLSGIYEEEQSRLHDPKSALEEAARRFGDPSELTQEFQKSLSTRERCGYAIERIFAWRAPESAARYVARQAALSFLIIAATFCITFALVLAFGQRIDAHLLRLTIAILILTPVAQFALSLLYYKMRDALWGAFGRRKSTLSVIGFAALSLLSTTAVGPVYVAITNGNLSRWPQFLPVFFTAGAMATLLTYLVARTCGRREINDAIWALLELQPAE